MKTQIRVREDRKEEFLSFIARINKRADKLGLSKVAFTFGEREVLPDKNNDPTGRKGLMLSILPCLVEGEEPVLSGWRFVAALDHEDGANIIRCKPGEEIDTTWRTAKGNCQHCGVNRNRLKTYLLRHESGEVKQVGSTCLGDFLGAGLNPENAAVYQEELFELSSRAWDSEPSYGGKSVLEVAAVLAVAAAHIRLYGWVSRAQAQVDYRLQPTASQVLGWLTFNPRRTGESEKNQWDASRPTEADTQKATDARTWAASLTPANDYEHNLSVIANLEFIGFNHIGLAVSLIAAYEKNLADTLKRQVSAATSQYFGEIGKRDTWNGVVTRITPIEGPYGTTWIIGFLVGNNEATWFASKRVDVSVGDTVRLTGSVKKHNDYKGIKQTVLTRCKIEKFIITN